MTGPNPVRILVLQHDPSDPLLRMADWLAETGASVEIRQLHLGDSVDAAELDGFDALISLGGVMGAWDDDLAPWLPNTRALLAQAVTGEVPTLGICLGAQLLAAATGGTVTTGEEGPEIGAYLAAKRDAALDDALFEPLPMTPDVMQYHYDIVSTLPPGASLLLSSTGYPHQAWRVGTCAWGLQFHIEPSAADLRQWAADEGIGPTRRLGPNLDEAQETMGFVWRDFVHRFVALSVARRDVKQTVNLVGRRLPLTAGQ